MLYWGPGIPYIKNEITPNKIEIKFIFLEMLLLEQGHELRELRQGRLQQSKI